MRHTMGAVPNVAVRESMKQQPELAPTNDGVPLLHVQLPRPLLSGTTSLMLGGGISTGGTMSGIIKAMHLLPSGIIRLTIECTSRHGSDEKIGHFDIKTWSAAEELQ